MNAPFLWILFPLVVATTLFYFRKQQNLVAFFSIGVAIILAWMAWQIPINQPLMIGKYAFRITDSLTILGRSITITELMRPFIGWSYFLVAVWSLGSILSKTPNEFLPFQLGIVSLLSAAISITPFLYAALIFELVVILSIPILLPPGKEPSRGLFKYLFFLTMGMPFILFTGWLLEGIEASPGNNDLVIQVIFLLGFGFSFLLSIFPFHSWKPMVAEVTHPYVMAFLFNLIPGFLFFLLLTFFNHYSWLRNSESLMTALMIIGGINVLIGGYRILFENNLGRVMGYLSVMEIGLILSAISIGGKECLSLAIGLMVGFNVSTFLFAITSSILFTHLGKVPKYEQLLGLGTKLPGISVLLILSLLGAIGFPLLSSFPVIFSLITRIGEQSLFVALMIFFGILGALSGGFRLIYTLFIQPEKSEKTIDNSEVYNSPKWLLIFISGYIILFLSGNFPQYYFGLFENLINFFDQF